MTMKLSVIVIEYHSIEEIRPCKDALQRCCDGIQCELIVSSNSCYPEDQQKKLQADFPDIRWQFNSENGGFAYGMNRGLEVASGDFLLISNPDVRIQCQLRPALEYIASHPKVGAVGPRIIDEKGCIQDSCRNFMRPWDMLKRQLTRFFTSRDVLLDKQCDYASIHPVDWVIGAFILLKREVYEKVGGLDENYFLYVEDMDWNYRIHRAGYEVHYFPELVIQYKGDRKSTRTIFHDKKLISHYGWLHFKSYCRFLYKWGLFFTHE